MLHGGIEMIGDFKCERLNTLPTWTAADESRLVYSNTTHRVYLGTNVSWKDISGSGDVMLDADTVDGIHATFIPKANTLLALDDSKQLPTSALYLNWHESSVTPSAGEIPVVDSDGLLNVSISGDAATLGGYGSSSYVRTDADSTIDEHTLTIIGSNGGMDVATGSKPALVVSPINGSTDPAMIEFVRTGVFSAYFGVDTDNLLKWGGASLGNHKYQVWTAYNMGHTSGLNADMTDGYHGSNVPIANYYLTLDENGQFPTNVLPDGTRMPVGAIVFFPMKISGTTSISNQFISMAGQSLDKTTYSALYSYLSYGGTQTAYFGESGNSFYLPDWRGLFFRMRCETSSGTYSYSPYDPDVASRIVPAGCNFLAQQPGSLQPGVVQKHMHPCGGVQGTSYGGTGLVDHQAWDNSYYNYYTVDFSHATDKNLGSLDSYSQTAVARGSETRPKNVYVEVGIKYV